jgi:hypothetical protein
MSDSDQPLSPEEEEVRRQLAEARHTGPTPPEVVARLDRVLDDLAHEPDRVAPVVDLARRRRRVASLLVAAAAVVVVGIGVAQIVTRDSGSETTSAESGAQARRPASADSKSEGQDSVQPKGPLNGAAEDSSDAPAPAPGSTPQEKSGLIRVRLNFLRDDFIAVRRLRGLDSQAYSPLRSANQADRAAGAACHADAWGQGRFVPVRYGKVPAVLVFRRPAGDTQVADLFLCGSDEPVRSVTLPAP